MGWLPGGSPEQDFDIGVVTNITHEHLDYHGSWENYLTAKGRLFEGLSAAETKDPSDRAAGSAQPGRPVLSAAAGADLGRGKFLMAGIRALRFGRQILRIPPMSCALSHMDPGLKFRLKHSMIGNYNVWNILAALSASIIGLGIDPVIAMRVSGH